MDTERFTRFARVSKSTYLWIDRQSRYAWRLATFDTLTRFACSADSREHLLYYMRMIMQICIVFKTCSNQRDAIQMKDILILGNEMR